MELLAGGVLTRTAVRGDALLITFNWIQPHHDEQPPHSHPFDQVSLVLAGTMEFDIAEDRYTVATGEVLQIPAGMPHTARVVGDDVAYNIDIFAPVREDYLHLVAHQADAFE